MPLEPRIVPFVLAHLKCYPLGCQNTRYREAAFLYNPALFVEDRPDVLRDLIREHSLATLVTLGPDGFLANHLPLIFDPEPAPFGTLRGHMARANRQWKDSIPGGPVLAIFQGPSAYITPSWYASKAEDGRVVPTYNYAVVHAHGALSTFEDPEVLEQHLRQLTNAHEAAFAQTWSVDDAPADHIRGLLRGIVGIEIRLTRLEGKWKVSQNRSIADRDGVVEGLRRSEDSNHQSMAALVLERMPSRK